MRDEASTTWRVVCRRVGRACGEFGCRSWSELLCDGVDVALELLTLIGVVARQPQTAYGAVDPLQALVHLDQLRAARIVLERRLEFFEPVVPLQQALADHPGVQQRQESAERDGDRQDRDGEQNDLGGV